MTRRATLISIGAFLASLGFAFLGHTAPDGVSVWFALMATILFVLGVLSGGIAVYTFFDFDD